MDHDLAAYLENVRLRRAELGDSMQALEGVLGEDHGDPRWVERVEAALMEVRHDLDDHVEVTERPDGLYDSVREDAPRLAGPLRQLQQEHPELLELTDVALNRALAGDAVDRVRLGDEVREVLRRLGHHRQKGADLIFEAYQMDVGGTG